MANKQAVLGSGARFKGKISGEVFYENISIEEGAIIEAQIGKRQNKK